MQPKFISPQVKTSVRNSTAARRVRAAVRTYPALDSLARRLLRRQTRLRSFAKSIPEGERSPNEITNALVLDLIKRQRLSEARTVIETFLAVNPRASRSRFIEGVVHLSDGEFRSARQRIDQAYNETWTIRDDMSQLPNWNRRICEAAAAEPDWAWPEYIRMKSLSKLTPRSPESLLALVDELEPPLIVEFSVKFGRPRHSGRPPLRRRMRAVVFEGTLASVQLQRLRMNHIDHAQVIHAPAIASAAERPGSWVPGAAVALLEGANLSNVDKMHVDAEFATADILDEILRSPFRPSVLTASLWRMTLPQRVATMRLLDSVGMRYDLSSDELVAVDETLVADRRVHAWRTPDADFNLELLDDYLTSPSVDLPARVQDVLIQNQVRFFITPTGNDRATRFSLTNGDKSYALSRLLEIDCSPYQIHMPSLSNVGTATPLVRLHLVDDTRRYLSRVVELDFWTSRGEYVRTANPNKFVNWIPQTHIERSMFAHNPAFLTNDADPAVTMEERLGLTESVMHHHPFPIDVVFTWVDGNDPQWQRRRAERQQLTAGNTVPVAPDDATQRYRSRDELRYALRSVRSFMPYVRHIYLVTDDQTPSWLDPDSSDITVVDHRDIFREPCNLPTFNSNAIETQLGNIPGLAEHFVYFNDDVMLLGPTPPEHFFFANGVTKSFLEGQQSQYGEASPNFHNSKNAVLNSSAAFERRFGRTFHQFHRHTPFPLRRSVLERMTDEFESELRETASHYFRSIHDVAPVSSLYQWFAFTKGAAVPSRIFGLYLNLGSSGIVDQLDAIGIRETGGVLCINDSPNEAIPDDEVDAAVSRTMNRLYPVPAPWERSA